MDIVKQIEEQITNYVDPTYSEQLSIIEEYINYAYEFYDDAGWERAIEDCNDWLAMLEEQLIDWPEDPFELDEEMKQQEEFCSNQKKCCV
jgi:hypothetical protein